MSVDKNILSVATKALAKMTSNYFYERCVVGLIDLAYPSNAATFLNDQLSPRLSQAGF